MQRLLPVWRGFWSLQQTESVGESIPDVPRAHRGHPRRRQLDPQRQCVEHVADLDHRGGCAGILEPELRPDGARPVDEQRDRIGCRATFTAQTATRIEASLRQPPVTRAMSRGSSTFPDRRRMAAMADAAAISTCSQLSTDEQQPLTGERLGHGVDQRGVALRRDAQRRRDGGGHRVPITDRRELDHPDAVREIAGELGTHLERQPASCRHHRRRST